MVKYYLKEKCKNWNNSFNEDVLRNQQRCGRFCTICRGSNFTRGADVTELMNEWFSRILPLHITNKRKLIEGIEHDFRDLIEVDEI